MGFKRVVQLILTVILLGGAILFGMSGVYHEAPWIVAPAIGSAKIELGGQRLSANTEQITAKISRREIPLLEYFTELRSADFRGSSCYREIAAWGETRPEVELRYSVPLPDGTIVDNTVQSLSLEWLTADRISELLDALTYLNEVSAVSLGEVGGERLSMQDMLRLREALPDAEFSFSSHIGGESVDGGATSIDLSAVSHEDIQSAAAILSCMQNLETVELGSESRAKIAWEDIALLKATCPNVDFHYRFTLYGKEVDLDTEKLDFRGVPVSDNGDALYPVLSCMNNCSYLDMDSTGVSNEALEKIRDLFPQTKVVWRIWFGEYYSVRTDAERILASKPTVGGMIYDGTVLKYCRDMKYLDLGHNDELMDLSFAMYMPKLEVLIIAMTGITDLSPLKNCSRLEYLEINSTNIADLSALEGHTALRHLNIAGCPKIKDISPLYGITEMERLWIGRDTPVPSDQVRKMRAAAPGCTINTTTEDPHGEAWRFTRYDPEEPKYYWVPRHELLRNQLGYNYQEYSFYWLDPLCDLPAPPEHAGKYGKGVYGL